MTDASGSRTQAQEDERQHSRNMPSQVQSKVTAGVQAGKQRIEGTPAKDLLSQLKDADLINEAMMFAALVLMVFFPFLITVAALGPLNQNGAADILVRKMGLSGEAAAPSKRSSGRTVGRRSPGGRSWASSGWWSGE